MNFFDKLKAQVNPFDGGKSFGNPEGRTQLPQAKWAAGLGSVAGQLPQALMAQPMQSAKLQVAQPQPYGQQSIGRVQQNGGAQPFGQGYEDEYTAENALQQGGYNPQTTRHGGFLQDGRTPMSGIVNPEDEYLHRLQKLLGY